MQRGGHSMRSAIGSERDRRRAWGATRREKSQTAKGGARALFNQGRVAGGARQSGGSPTRADASVRAGSAEKSGMTRVAASAAKRQNGQSLSQQPFGAFEPPSDWTQSAAASPKVALSCASTRAASEPPKAGS